MKMCIFVDVVLNTDYTKMCRETQKKNIRSCFEFLQKVFLGLMYPFSCVLWAINSKQLLSDGKRAELSGYVLQGGIERGSLLIVERIDTPAHRVAVDALVEPRGRLAEIMLGDVAHGEKFDNAFQLLADAGFPLDAVYLFPQFVHSVAVPFVKGIQLIALLQSFLEENESISEIICLSLAIAFSIELFLIALKDTHFL